MTRVWLAPWEWSCCGDPFVVGDLVDFGIETRMPTRGLIELLGSEIAGTVDASESHHEHEFTDRVRGRVVAVHEVTHEVVERRTLRRPGHGAPPDAVMPQDGEEWPMIGRDLGNGVFVGSRPSRFMIEIAPVPGTAVLEPTHGVGREAPQEASPAKTRSEPPPERIRRSLAGWLVDVEEHRRQERASEEPE